MNGATDQSPIGPTLPPSARLSINRCNLPAVILGSARFQQKPAALLIDGVREFHHELFAMLEEIDTVEARAERFMDYMTVYFRLEHLEDAGFDKARVKKSRAKADYLRALRGWSFDSDGREGAVLKSWVESRFGLLPRHHKGPLRDFTGDNYQDYVLARARGLYNTNALEEQLDLLYSFCQYELERRFPGSRHLTLHRGVNRVDEYETIEWFEEGRRGLFLLNNLNSFTAERDRADEFGDYILTAEVPLPKVFGFTDLLPGRLRGEAEFMVIGGVYEATVSTL